MASSPPSFIKVGNQTACVQIGGVENINMLFPCMYVRCSVSDQTEESQGEGLSERPDGGESRGMAQ